MRPHAAPVRLVRAAAAAARPRPCRAGSASLAVTGGVHTGLDVVKAVMAGAHAVADGLGAAAPRPRPPADRAPRGRGVAGGARVESLGEMRGSMSLAVPDPAAYERANFRMALR